MKRVVFVLVLLAAVVPGDALLAQAEISARGANIRIGGRLHSQYQMSSVDGTESDFFFRRARLIADVTVNDFWTARVQTDFAGGTATLQDAYVRMNFSDNFQISMGQFKRAFDLFELSSSTELSIIERDGRVAGVGGCTGVGGACSYSRLTEQLDYAGRDAGLRFEASGEKVSFMGTITNGTGANVRDENSGKSFSGRLTFEATEDLAISGQIARHDYLDVLDETQSGMAWGLDAEYGGFRDGFHLQASISGGDNWLNPDGAGDPTKFLAWQAVAATYLPLQGERVTAWEPLIRISQGDPDTDLDDDGSMIFTPGLMLYISGRNKIGFNFDVYSPQGGGDTEYGLKIQSFLYF